MSQLLSDDAKSFPSRAVQQYEEKTTIDKSQEIFAKSFYMMRHGQSTSNVQELASGGNDDCDLSSAGLQQAKGARQLLALLKPQPTKIVVTGLKRSVNTAIYATGKDQSEFIIEQDLKERSFGIYDGKIPNAQRNDVEDKSQIESYDQHKTRVIKGLNRQLESHKDDTILFVTHGGTIRRLVDAIGNRQDRLTTGNTALYHFVSLGAGKWQLNLLSVENDKLKTEKIDLNNELGSLIQKN